MNKLILALLVLALPAAAQEADRVQKIFEIKHADPQRLANLLSVFGVGMQVDNAMKIIAVQGRRDSVSALEDAIKRLDVPSPAQKNVELTFHILQATPTQLEDKPPAELEDVTKRLRALFSYQGFSLLDTVVMRVRDGQGSNASGMGPARLSKGSAKSHIDLAFRAAHLAAAEKASVVRIDKLNFRLRLPFLTGKDKEANPQYQYAEASIGTDLDVREGQKVVVGKTAMEGADGAVILIVTAKVVE